MKDIEFNRWEIAHDPSKFVLQQSPCPLCDQSTYPLYTSFQTPQLRSFHHCPHCDLISVPPKFFMTLEEEKFRYTQHRNDPKDPGYRAFLSRAIDELRPLLNKNSCGLDYGSGPQPALATILREEGFNINIYDPFFSPDTQPLFNTYDFITCTETVEHFHHPKVEFNLLNRLLKRGGWLAIMTGMVENLGEFPHWHYYRDPTHVSFYSKASMNWIAERFGWQISFPRKDVTLFKKQN